MAYHCIRFISDFYYTASMAVVTINTSIPSDAVEAFVEKVHKACNTDPNLSYRSVHEIKVAYEKGLILIALEDKKIAGWLLRIPYNSGFQELAAGFVDESYRSKGVFAKLLESALCYPLSSCIVTFNRSLAHRLLHTFHFRNSSLGEAVWLSKGKFLTHRLSLSRMYAIKKHYQSGKPIYIIFSKT